MHVPLPRASFTGARVRAVRVLAAVVYLAVCAHAQAAAPDAPRPPGMVWIPGGEYTMGSDDARAQANERPAHRVRVDGFWMDETTVTNAQFRAFADATGYVTTAERAVDWKEIEKQVPPGTPKPPDEMLQPGSLVFRAPDHAVPLGDLGAWWRWTIGASWRHPEGPGSDLAGKDDEPVVHVGWDDAVAYATWAKKRLPTEAEWERAARGGLDGKRFVWGDEFLGRDGGGKTRHLANTFQGDFPHRSEPEDGFAARSPVRAFPPNAFGLHDMAGNVWNWCSDLYSAAAHEESASKGCCENPVGPARTWDPADPHTPVRRVIKGGSFLCHVSYCESYRPSARRGTPPDTGSSHVGFRCVMTAAMWEQRAK